MGNNSGNARILAVSEGGTGATTASVARTNLGIGSVSPLAAILASGTITFTSISANSEQSHSVTVTGADPGADYNGISLNWDDALESGIIVKQAYVETNAVTIIVANVTGSPIVPAARNVQVVLLTFTV